MKRRVLVLGAGFGGLELTSCLSEAMGDELDLILIDRSDSFVFGFSKLDLMFGLPTTEPLRLMYSRIRKSGVTFRQEVVESIDPKKRKVVTDKEKYEADVLVVALGADYDIGATPGLREDGHEFYTHEGALRCRDALARFKKGRALVGVHSAPFKCPPAPTEAALLLHDYLTKRGIRASCQIDYVMPFHAPIPPSPDTSRALVAAFQERMIAYHPGRGVRSLDNERHVATLDDGTSMDYDLFLGVPKHRVPDVVEASGMTEDGWIQVSSTNLKTKFPNVYAIGDVASADVPKAGMFAEGEARAAAASMVAGFRGGDPPQGYDGRATCYIEFGSGVVARTEMDFLSDPYPQGKYYEPSAEISEEKRSSAKLREARWFGS